MTRGTAGAQTLKGSGQSAAPLEMFHVREALTFTPWKGRVWVWPCWFIPSEICAVCGWQFQTPEAIIS